MTKNLLLLLLLFPLGLFAQNLYFPPGTGAWETLSPDSLDWCDDSLTSLQTFLEDMNSKAFIILKDGKIVVEWYYDGFTENSTWYWASAGKTMTATLIGMAQQEGLLSIDSASSTYLGQGWTSCDSIDESAITVRHQLTMTAGFDESDYRWDCTDDTCLQCQVPPGTRWFYHNAPYTLLTNVVEGASNMPINSYFASRIGNHIGMGTSGFVRLGYTRLFLSRARDMARFGLFTLAKGSWDGNQILADTTYYQQMVTTSQSLNPSYGYLWWLNGKSQYMLPGTRDVYSGPIIPNAPADLFAGLGANDQKVYVVPSQNLVVIRLGQEAIPNTLSLSSFDNDLWGKISRLDEGCNSTTGIAAINEDHWRVYPQPASGKFNIESDFQISTIRLRNLSGQQILSIPYQATVSAAHLPRGLYIIEVFDYQGNVSRRMLNLL